MTLLVSVLDHDWLVVRVADIDSSEDADTNDQDTSADTVTPFSTVTSEPIPIVVDTSFVSATQVSQIDISKYFTHLNRAFCNLYVHSPDPAPVDGHEPPLAPPIPEPDPASRTHNPVVKPLSQHN